MMEQKKKKHGKVFILIVIAIILLIVVTIVLACIFSGKDKSEEDIGKVYYYQTELEHIACENSGIMYADNEILIVADSNTKEKYIQKLAEKYDAEIVGCIEATGDYQWLLADTYTRDELEAFARGLESEEIIESACVNYVFEATINSDQVIYGQEWDGETWDESDTDGSNWGLEAIHAIGAWEYIDQMSPIRIGLIDGGFDASNSVEQLTTTSASNSGHEDLEFEMTFYNNIQEIINKNGVSSVNHGTHVAGIMAAISDNDEGTCGAYPFGNGNLYGASFQGVGEPIILPAWVKNVHMLN